MNSTSLLLGNHTPLRLGEYIGIHSQRASVYLIVHLKFAFNRYPKKQNKLQKAIITILISIFFIISFIEIVSRREGRKRNNAQIRQK